MIRVVVALPAEAKPLINRYRLKRDAANGEFPVYTNEDMALIVSGVGKVAAAGATAYLHAIANSRAHSVWLNVGIAGHAERAVGDGVLAHRITDQRTKRNWYPPLIFDPFCETEAVVTVDNAERAYAESSIYDMEASGYYPLACRFSTSGLVHCFKVVSDNRIVSTETISAKTVRALITRQLDVIDQIICQLSALSAELPRVGPNPARLDQYVERWRFTVSEQHKLRRLLTRWQTLCPNQEPWSHELERLPSGAAVLAFLEGQLDGLPARPY